jgi:outer membrane receptor protein involved in Fe transport
VLTLANPDLAPERARSADAAVSVSGAAWSLSGGGFWTVVEDAIANVTQSAGPPIVRRRQNAGEARARGFELDADVRLGARAGLRLSALVVDARFRASAEPALEGNQLPQVPRTSVSLSGYVRPRTWLLAAATWRGLSSQFDDDRNVFTLAAARQLDLRLGATRGAWTAHATVENALDARVEVGRTPLVTLAPGRAARLGLTWRR